MNLPPFHLTQTTACRNGEPEVSVTIWRLSKGLDQIIQALLTIGIAWSCQRPAVRRAGSRIRQTRIAVTNRAAILFLSRHNR